MRQVQGAGLVFLAVTLGGCANLSWLSSPELKDLPLASSCGAYFKLKNQLAETETNPSAEKPTWQAGECQQNRTNSHIGLTCAWQLQTLAAAKTFWRYQYEQLAQCFSGEWFHKVDGLAASAYFRDDEKFVISLDRISTQLDLNSKLDSKIKKHQVHLSFQVYSPVLIGGDDGAAGVNGMHRKF